MESFQESQEIQESPEVPSSDAGEKLSFRGMSAIQGINEVAPGEEKTPSEGEFVLDPTNDSQRQVEEGISQLNQIEGIRPDVWQESSESERLAALQQVESTMSAIQGRPGVDVKTGSMSPGTYGYFDGNVIFINSDMINSDDAAENVDTVVHEGRHAYQQYAVNHPDMHSDESEVMEWKDNFDNYLDADQYGQELYQNQPVEADAWSYGSAIRQGIYGSQEVQL